MATNITAELVKEETLNSNLSALDDTQVEKYIKRALALVSSYINTAQFTGWNGDVEYPDELVTVIVCIIEYIFVDNGMFGGGPNSMQSEKIGDYSYTKKDSRASKKMSGLDLPDNIMAILDKYVTRGGNLSIDVGGLDREYYDEDL